MRGVESIMPCISLRIMSRENVYPFELWNLYKTSILESGLEEFRLWVPHIFVEHGSVSKIILDIVFLHWFCHLTDTKIIITELKSFTAARMTWLWAYIPLLQINLRVWSWIESSSFVCVSQHKAQQFLLINGGIFVSLLEKPIGQYSIRMGSNHTSGWAICKRPFRHVASLPVYDYNALGDIVKSIWILKKQPRKLRSMNIP